VGSEVGLCGVVWWVGGDDLDIRRKAFIGYMAWRGVALVGHLIWIYTLASGFLRFCISRREASCIWIIWLCILMTMDDE